MNTKVVSFSIPSYHVDIVQKLADAVYSGNRSMAIRHIIECWSDDDCLYEGEQYEE